MATINGTSGDDTLKGTANADTINGYGGNDILNGLGGKDFLNGGVGNDSEGVDRITDFTLGAGNDLLDLTGMNLNVSPATLPSFIQFNYDGADTHVLVDADGGGDNFVEIAVLQGVHMTGSDTDNYAL